MINVPHGYQDAHGIVYTGGIILINHMNHSSHTNIQLNLAVEVEAIKYNDNGFNTSAQLGFTAVIYPNQQALDERRPPLPFRPQGHPEYFNVTLDGTLTKEQLLNTCEQWLLANILTGGE